MTRKTGRYWKTENCGRCDTPHVGYSGKLDANGVEYVVCGSTDKRMNVSGTGLEGHTFAFPGVWVQDTEAAAMKAARTYHTLCQQAGSALGLQAGTDLTMHLIPAIQALVEKSQTVNTQHENHALVDDIPRDASYFRTDRNKPHG